MLSDKRRIGLIQDNNRPFFSLSLTFVLHKSLLFGSFQRKRRRRGRSLIMDLMRNEVDIHIFPLKERDGSTVGQEGKQGSER